jgi:hypothetical protein
MTTTTISPIGKDIRYDHSIIEDKHFFGGYFNLAQNNIDLALQSFCERNNIDYTHHTKLSDVIKSALSKETSYTEWERKMDFLKQFFPVLRFLYPKQRPADNVALTTSRAWVSRDFIRLLDLTEKFRHFYTHYYHEPIPVEKQDTQLLNLILLRIIEKVKKQKLKTDNTKQLLKESLKDELAVLIKQKKEFLSEKQKEEYEACKESPNRKPKKYQTSDEHLFNAVMNDCFHHLIFKDPEKGTTKLNKNHFAEMDGQAENGVTLSQSGVLTLLSMFLTKRQNEDLRARITGFKGKVHKDLKKEISRQHNSLKNMCTHWVFSHASFKPVNKKLNTTFTKETLLTQMMDELSKVPHELYEVLSEENKKEFLFDLNAQLRETQTLGKQQNDWAINQVIRKRYERKFNYFAIRYLDEYANFPSLRFQVHLGNYIHNRENKKIGTSNFETERVIKEKILVFGKLTEVTQLKNDFFIQHNTDESTWEQFPNPSYHVNEGNVLIYLDLANSKVPGAKAVHQHILALRQAANKEQRLAKKPSKTAILGELSEQGNQAKHYLGEATAVFSLNELKALLYELLVNKKEGKHLEEILIKTLVARYQLISNVSCETEFKNSLLSKKLKKAKDTKQINFDKLQRAITAEINLTDERLALITTNQRELNDSRHKRKLVFTAKEIGQAATWLTDDLIRFMPKANKATWKGIHHSHLQKTLAFYDRQKNEAKELINLFWKFDSGTIWGENIKKAFKERTFEGLYKCYLLGRKDSLETIQEQLKNTPDKLIKKYLAQHVWPLFKKKLYTIERLAVQKERLLTHPLVFPRGIFDPKPTFIKGVNMLNSPEQFASWYQLAYQKQPLQSFYDLPRDYGLAYSLLDQNEQLTLSKNGVYEHKAQFAKRCEMVIRHVQTEDVYTKLMVDKLCQEVFGHVIPLTLADLYVDKTTRQASIADAWKQKERKKGDDSPNIFRLGSVWDRLVPFKHEQISETQVPLKDLGKFKRLVFDKKTALLLAYDPTRTWNKLSLENTLYTGETSYEYVRRECVLKTIHTLEKAILNLWQFDGKNHPKELKLGGNPNFRMYLVQTVQLLELADKDAIGGLKSWDKIESNHNVVRQAFYLTNLRNQFAHNNLPEKHLFDAMKKDHSDLKPEEISIFLLEVCRRCATFFLSKINAYETNTKQCTS